MRESFKQVVQAAQEIYFRSHQSGAQPDVLHVVVIHENPIREHAALRMHLRPIGTIIL